MSVLDRIATDKAAIAQRARVRHAWERLNRIDEIRDVAILARQGLKQREIAEQLGTTQPRVHRIQKLLALRGQSVEETPEEIILRAFVAPDGVPGGVRRELIERLKALDYTFGETDPTGGDGYVAGTWDDVRRARAKGLLADEEYAEVRSAVHG
ncbi:hypothetical protein [Nocardioides sp. W7]|uniref:hypothetical protein n=1 Tax=Nocardioides sp. W7 TaxID=2931390 RepID=UPI001FD4750D|nr:hypothetical protein [Nocardioides sp. W7]